MNYKILLKNSLILLSILIIILMQSTEAAGAWTQKKGNGYYKMDFRYLSGTKIYSPDGVKVPIPKFTDITIGIFGSYGITDEFTGFIGAAPYKSVKLDTTAAAFGSDTDVSGFGDIALGGKYRIAKFGK